MASDLLISALCTRYSDERFEYVSSDLEPKFSSNHMFVFIILGKQIVVKYDEHTHILIAQSKLNEKERQEERIQVGEMLAVTLLPFASSISVIFRHISDDNVTGDGGCARQTLKQTAEVLSAPAMAEAMASASSRSNV